MTSGEHSLAGMMGGGEVDIYNIVSNKCSGLYYIAGEDLDMGDFVAIDEKTGFLKKVKQERTQNEPTDDDGKQA